MHLVHGHVTCANNLAHTPTFLKWHYGFWSSRRNGIKAFAKCECCVENTHRKFNWKNVMLELSTVHSNWFDECSVLRTLNVIWQLYIEPKHFNDFQMGWWFCQNIDTYWFGWCICLENQQSSNARQPFETQTGYYLHSSILMNRWK